MREAHVCETAASTLSHHLAEVLLLRVSVCPQVFQLRVRINYCFLRIRHVLHGILERFHRRGAVVNFLFKGTQVFRSSSSFGECASEALDNGLFVNLQLFEFLLACWTRSDQFTNLRIDRLIFEEDDCNGDSRYERIRR